MEEIWKAIDDRYSVSNLGRVKSNALGKEQILKQRIVHNYLRVNLYISGKMKTVSVHRLVAQAFIPNPDNFPQVNHKDENKLNNYAENLEWCTPKYNCNYGSRTLRSASAHERRICSIDQDGNIEYFDSGREAEEKTGIKASTISNVLSGKRNIKTAGGRLWVYDNGDVEKIVQEMGLKVTTKKRPVYSIDKNGNIEYFESASDAKRKTGANNIHYSIKNGTKSGGRQWFYIN